jgi:predicted  nucleic acid-binding Zn-ribbon protein
MKRTVLFCAVFAFVFTSCVKNSSEYKALQARNDSLALATAQANVELDQIMALLNEVEDNFRSIKSAENYLASQSTGSGELTPSVRSRIQSDMQFITETLDKNRQRIADLEAKLKKSNFNLSKTLAGLRQELEEKTNTLVTMQEELAKRDRKIADLTDNVNRLSDDVKSLSDESSNRQKVIDRQWTELNTAYYCFGTSKELKDQKILVGGQLGTNFNHNYFIPVENINTQKVIRLYAKKGKLISKHPAGSYTFAKDASGQAELRILNPKDFWSLTKYLVIEVKV